MSSRRTVRLAFLLLLLVVQETRAQQRAQASARSSLKEIAANSNERLVLAIAEFHALWQTKWRYSEQFRISRSGEKVHKDRHKYFHCDVSLFEDKADRWQLRKTWGNPEPYYMIRGRLSAFGVCPSWLLTADIEMADDETVWRDGAILPNLRPDVFRARSKLISELRTAFALQPSNEWISGQLVRLVTDQRDYALAHAVTKECTAAHWWCKALEGYVHAKAGDILSADSAFAAMRRRMSDSLRTQWDNLRQWLADDVATEYTRALRNVGDTTFARLWWLSDPLYREAGNARSVEQDLRQMEVALRSAVTQDERYSFDERRGGDAVATAIRRYGWPSYTGWASPDQERSHSMYLERSYRSPPAPPYTTFEYTLDRVRTLPSPTVISKPFESASSDWKLQAEEPRAGPVTNWWPEEHFRHHRRLVQLPDGQTVMVRRHAHVEVVTALTLSHPAVQDGEQQFDVMLLSTTGPNDIDSLDQQTARNGSSVVLRAPLKSSPALLAIEALGVGATRIDARTRFGFQPPEPLQTMQSGDIAVSDIALLRRLSESLLQSPGDSLLKALLPSKTLSQVDRMLTLYWESYGTTPEDSASFSVRVESAERPGVLERVGVATGLVTDPASSIAIRWKDVEGRASTTTLRGPVPVQMRALNLNLGALRPGKYSIEVIITMRDGRSASSRTFVELTT